MARTVYIHDAPALIDAPAQRAVLVARIGRHELSGVAPYHLGPLLSDADGRGRVAAWFDEVHLAGGAVIVPVAGLDRIDALAALVAEHPGTWLDGAVTEHEYWNRADRAAGLAELRALLGALATRARDLAPGHALRVGAYLGYPTEAEAADLATRVDFVHLDYSVRDPVAAWRHVHAKGGPLRDRYGWFARAGVDVWPIFYATGEVDMAPALRVDGLAGVEARFRADQAADPTAGALPVAGFAYFTLEAVPARAWAQP